MVNFGITNLLYIQLESSNYNLFMSGLGLFFPTSLQQGSRSLQLHQAHVLPQQVPDGQSVLHLNSGMGRVVVCQNCCRTFVTPVIYIRMWHSIRSLWQILTTNYHCQGFIEIEITININISKNFFPQT
jgi:hypothetical protein